MSSHKFLVRKKDANLWGGLFGGKLLQEIDMCGYYTARKALEKVEYDYIITAEFNKIKFIKPTYPKDIVILNGEIYKIGKSSLHIKITAVKENTKGELKTVSTANGVYVCMKNDKPYKHGLSKA